MDDGFPAGQRQNPDWLTDVEFIACNDAVLPDYLDSEVILVKRTPITVFYLPVLRNGQKGTIHILYCPDITQGAKPHSPSGWADLDCFPDDLQKTVRWGQHLVRITEGQHHLVHESGLVIYGTNKRCRSKLARLLADEAWFKSRKKITSFEHGYTSVSFESIPFLSCGNLGYQEDPQTQDHTFEQATPKRVMLPTEDFSSPYIWAAKVMFDALTAMQQSIIRAEGLLDAIEQSDSATQKAALMDIRTHINKSKTEVTFLLEQFVPIAQRGSCEVMLEV